MIGEPSASQSVYARAEGPHGTRAAVAQLRALPLPPLDPTLRDSSIPHQIVVNRVAELLRADMVRGPPATTRERTRHKPNAV